MTSKRFARGFKQYNYNTPEGVGQQSEARGAGLETPACTWDNGRESNGTNERREFEGRGGTSLRLLWG